MITTYKDGTFQKDIIIEKGQIANIGGGLMTTESHEYSLTFTIITNCTKIDNLILLNIKTNLIRHGTNELINADVSIGFTKGVNDLYVFDSTILDIKFTKDDELITLDLTNYTDYIDGCWFKGLININNENYKIAWDF